jgi:RHS repeat-associated protein
MSIQRLFVALAVLIFSSATIADHGSGGHINLNLNVPATSSTGNYTITWTDIGTTELWEKLDGTGYWSNIATDVSSMYVSGRAEGTHSYRVRQVFCIFGNCTYEYTVSQAIVVSSAPDTPEPITGPSSSESGSYSLSWPSSTGADGYRLQESPDQSSWTTILDNEDQTAYLITGQADGDYWYKVQACDGASCSSYSTEKQVTVDTSNPTPPSMGAYDATDFPDATVVYPSGTSGDQNVGALKASGGVSGGQASYSIPIQVPPGRKGMQPAVSLGYSSSSGYGNVGVGWSLRASSSITRCAATPATDGFIAAVQYHASNDRLCLDGQKLVASSGTYGVSGTEYRTELDSFMRVTQEGGNLNDGSTYFEVEYKNGIVNTYGGEPGARHSADGRTETLTWAISDSQDRSGNTITYDYESHVSGEYTLDEIHYTGYNGSDGDRHVKFEYEADQSPRTSYLAGGMTRRTKRIQFIDTFYDTTKVRRYKLEYKTSLTSARSLLESVQECAYESTTEHCFPATNFEWQEKATSFKTEPLQIHNGSSWVPQLTNERFIHKAVPHGDTNGDGLKDFVGFSMNAEGQSTGDSPDEALNCYFQFGSVGLRCLDIDFDNDGRTDGFKQENGELKVKRATSSTWVGTDISWTTDLNAEISEMPVGFADFNGDGYTDMAFKHAAEMRIYLHTGDVTDPYDGLNSNNRVDVFTYGYSGINYPTTYTHSASIVGDMDGNGIPDFLLSEFRNGVTRPGLPTPDVIKLINLDSGGLVSVSTRYITGINPEVENAVFTQDVNGDGLPDLVSSYGGALEYRLNKGDDFEANWTSLGVGIPIKLVEYVVNPGETAFAAVPVMSKVLQMDYDGNGIVDFLYADTVLASGCAYITEGTSPPSYEWRCDEELYDGYQANTIELIGRELNSGVLDESVRSYKVITLSENASGAIVASSPFDSGIVASAAQTAAIDATGDGLVDVVTVFGCRQDGSLCKFNNEASGIQGATVETDYSQQGAWINRNLGTATDQSGNDSFEFAGYDLMNAAEDAFGNRHEWTYKPLSSDKYDTALGEFYETDHSYQENDHEYFHFTSSMNVVAEHLASDGIGGMNSTKFRYGGAIYSTKGRGFQGFRTIIEEQDLYTNGHALAGTDKITRTDFHQKWPISSIVDESCTFLAIDNVQDDNPNCVNPLNETTTNLIHNVATVGGARFVAIQSQTAKKFDLSTRTEVTSYEMHRNFDGEGNITYESHSSIDNWGERLTETTNVFAAPNFATWWLDRLSYKTITYNPVLNRHASSPTIALGTDNAKTVTNTFSEYDSAHRLPTVVTTSASDTATYKTVRAAFNQYGLPSTVESFGTDIPEVDARKIESKYSNDGNTESADGYFVIKATNALGHETEQHSDPRFGTPTKQWDPNDLVTETSYDAFGRVTILTPPGEPAMHTRFDWCDGAPVCAAGELYRVQTITAGAPTASAFFDKRNRQLRKAVDNFGATGHVEEIVEYNKRGFVSRRSVPFDISKGDTWGVGTRIGEDYDAFGRMTRKEVDSDDGHILITTYSYSDLTTSISAGGLPIMTRTHDGAGQLVQTVDAEGGSTNYAYDGAGNPIAIADPKDSTITALYNGFGHKVWVSDPNMGLRNFEYNGVGEVISELDGNGDEIEMIYDRLGRVIERLVNDVSDAKWYFDNTGLNKGLGLLDYEDSLAESDGTRLQKFYFYSDGTGGRKDLLQVTHRFFEGTTYVDYETQYFVDAFYARPKGMHYPGGTKLAYMYDGDGYLTHEKDPISGFVYREITNRNALQQTLNANLSGGAMTQVTGYNTATGQMKSHDISDGNSIVNLDYDYDPYGNLDYATTVVGGNTSSEDFFYDYLHRLKTSTRFTPSGSSTITYTYDAAGNLKSKSDYATNYDYTGGGPNAVSSVTLAGGGTASFTYDGNGNMKTGHNKGIDYNVFNKPTRIEVGSVDTDYFTYGADLSRYRHETSAGKDTLYLDKHMEIVTVGTTTDYRHYIGDIAILTKTGALNDPSPGIEIVHRDRLGSVAILTDTSGGDVRGRGFDPFGKPRNENWSDRNPTELGRDETERGYTDHEHLDDAQLIHMNGRAYDYNLGRFLSVDPIIQAPGNSQSLNPYSYIMNNPLAGVDPSGYCGRATNINSEGGSICADTEGYYLSTSFSLDHESSHTETSSGDNGASSSGGLASASPGDGSGSSAESIESNRNTANALFGSKRKQHNEDVAAEYEKSVAEHGEKPGTLKVGKDLELKFTTSGPDGFDDQVNDDLRELRKTESGLAMLVGIAESGQTVKVFSTFWPTATERSTDPVWGATIIGIAPKGLGGFTHMSANGGRIKKVIETTYTLAHELVHAWQNTVPRGSPVPRMERNVPVSSVRFPEIEALRYTNLIRIERGEKWIRVQYSRGEYQTLDKFVK